MIPGCEGAVRPMRRHVRGSTDGVERERRRGRVGDADVPAWMGSNVPPTRPRRVTRLLLGLGRRVGGVASTCTAAASRRGPRRLPASASSSGDTPAPVTPEMRKNGTPERADVPLEPLDTVRLVDRVQLVARRRASACRRAPGRRAPARAGRRRSPPPGRGPTRPRRRRGGSAPWCARGGAGTWSPSPWPSCAPSISPGTSATTKRARRSAAPRRGSASAW